ncbi:MAG: heavy-metal-associated domain-containing protein [Rhodothermus sp.]|nr:heavy-metal-associated domain-containing protein [Rhodothermus sp.]
MMVRTLSLTALLMLLGSVAYAQEKETAVPDTTQADAVVYMKGLTCEMCARSVSVALQRVEGVADVQVFLEEPQRALLTLKEGAQVGEKALRTAVEKAGFEVERVHFRSKKGSS